MINHDLFYMGEKDLYKERFLENGTRFLKTLNGNLDKQQIEQQPFSSFSIINHTCNLNCPYCVVDYVRDGKQKKVKKKKKEKLARLLKCIDQLFDAFDNGQTPLLRMVYNGGEILLEWEIVKATVEYIRTRYPNVDAEFNLNTNGTLMDKKKVKFLARHRFTGSKP